VDSGDITHFEGMPKLMPQYGGLLELKDPKFKLLNFTFNAKNFIRRLQLIFEMSAAI